MNHESVGEYRTAIRACFRAVTKKRNDPPPVARRRVAQTGGLSGSLLALRAFHREIVKPERPMNHEVRSAARFRAEHVEVGCRRLRPGVRRRRRGQEPDAPGDRSPEDDRADHVHEISNRRRFPDETRFLAHRGPPDSQPLAQDWCLGPRQHQPFDQPIGFFLGHAAHKETKENRSRPVRSPGCGLQPARHRASEGTIQCHIVALHDELVRAGAGIGRDAGVGIPDPFLPADAAFLVALQRSGKASFRPGPGRISVFLIRGEIGIR